MRTCTRCRETKEETEFPTRKGHPCYACKRKESTAWRAANPEKAKQARLRWWHNRTPEQKKDIWLRKAYGMTLEEYTARCEELGWRCEICRQPCEELFVDHDHVTNAVRGFLCDACNKGLGFLADSPERLRIAAAYLEGGDRA